MNPKPTDIDSHLDPDILNKAYTQFFLFVSDFVGEKKAREFALQSYTSTKEYYSGISVMVLDDKNVLRFKDFEITDREILGFGIWMYQFTEELRKFMVGIGKIDPYQILGKWSDPLQSTHFFEYFNQAKELKY